MHWFSIVKKLGKIQTLMITFYYFLDFSYVVMLASLPYCLTHFSRTQEFSNELIWKIDEYWKIENVFFLLTYILVKMLKSHNRRSCVFSISCILYAGFVLDVLESIRRPNLDRLKFLYCWPLYALLFCYIAGRYIGFNLVDLKPIKGWTWYFQKMEWA